MAINIQKLVKAFKEFCYDLKGKLEEKYPSYTCKISRTSSHTEKKRSCRIYKSNNKKDS